MKNLEFIRELIDKFNDSDIGKIEVADGDFKILLESKKQNVYYNEVSYGKDNDVMIPVAAGNFSSQSRLVEPEEFSGNVVVSPIVGTFYASASPGGDPFVKVGQKISKGDILFIIESMKLMNEVKSDFEGVVSKIFVKNGEAVEYGQKIMIIE